MAPLSAPYVLALTFTRKAASELRGRLSSLGLAEPATAGTFHAVALGELRRLAAERGRPAPVVVASKARLLAAAAGREVGRDRAHAGGPRLRDRVGAGSLPDDARATRAPRPRPGATASANPALVTEVWSRYEREKQRRGVLDFDDLLVRCASRARRRTPSSPPRPDGGSVTSSSTSTRTSTPRRYDCSRRGSATTTISASSAIPTRRSTPGTGATHGPCIDFPAAASGLPRSSASP